MWKICKLLMLFIVATVCHWGFATLFSYVGINVNFMLIFAMAFCTAARLEVGYPVVFICGLFLDFFGTKLFGNNAFSFTVAAIVVYSLKERIDFISILPQMVMVFLLTCLVGVLNGLVLMRFTSASFWPGMGSLLGGALVGAFLAPMVFAAVRFVWEDSSAENLP